HSCIEVTLKVMVERGSPCGDQGRGEDGVSHACPIERTARSEHITRKRRDHNQKGNIWLRESNVTQRARLRRGSGDRSCAHARSQRSAAGTSTVPGKTMR